MESGQIPITAEKYKAIEDEIESLKADSKKLSEEIARARDLGDLSENAEYHAAREQKGMIDAKISQLKGKLLRYKIVDKSDITGDTVQFGTKVKLFDALFDEEIECEIVGEGAGNNINEISVSSPVGKALLNHKKGDDVEVKMPNGKTMKYKILDISI